MRNLLAVALLAITIACAPGCGTTMMTTGGDWKPYGGTDMDLWVIQSPISSGVERLGAALDVPFSLVADAALLPFTMVANYELNVEATGH